MESSCLPPGLNLCALLISVEKLLNHLCTCDKGSAGGAADVWFLLTSRVKMRLQLSSDCVSPFSWIYLPLIVGRGLQTDFPPSGTIKSERMSLRSAPDLVRMLKAFLLPTGSVITSLVGCNCGGPLCPSCWYPFAFMLLAFFFLPKPLSFSPFCSQRQRKKPQWSLYLWRGLK